MWVQSCTDSHWPKLEGRDRVVAENAGAKGPQNRRLPRPFTNLSSKFVS